MPESNTFESHYEEIAEIVRRRKSGWTYLSLMQWDEVSQLLLIRIWEKWALYDPNKAPLEHWVNRLVSNALLNLRRDTLLRWSRPCIGGGKTAGKSCVFNTGGDTCSNTPSKKQCSECPLYAEWQKTREPQFNIKSNVALEHHAQEVSNMQGDFSDADEIKKELDAAMHKELTQWEYRVYRMIYIEHLTPAQASEKLEALIKTWKRAPRAEETPGYQSILQVKRQLENMMRIWLSKNGYFPSADYGKKTCKRRTP